MSEEICWSCSNSGGEMLHFGNIHIHNKPECRHAAGIPDDEPKHDGKLDKQGEVEVEIRDNAIIMLSHPGQDDLILTPTQALSLLVWLKQEEPTLQKLVEEEEKKQ